MQFFKEEIGDPEDSIFIEFYHLKILQIVVVGQKEGMRQIPIPD